jgi:hypothetical protein
MDWHYHPFPPWIQHGGWKGISVRIIEDVGQFSVSVAAGLQERRSTLVCYPSETVGEMIVRAKKEVTWDVSDVACKLVYESHLLDPSRTLEAVGIGAGAQLRLLNTLPRTLQVTVPLDGPDSILMKDAGIQSLSGLYDETGESTEDQLPAWKKRDGTAAWIFSGKKGFWCISSWRFCREGVHIQSVDSHRNRSPELLRDWYLYGDPSNIRVTVSDL